MIEQERNMVLKRIVSKAVVVGALAFMTGCAAAPEVKQRFYWPPLPDEPKIEWLGAYRSKFDMPRAGFEKLMAKIVGTPDALYLDRPVGILSDGGDRVFISDVAVGQVLVFDFKKRDVTFLGAGQDEPVSFSQPSGLAIDAVKNIYVCDTEEKRIYVFSPEEKMLRSFDISKQAKHPVGLAVDNDRKRLLVGDVRAQVIHVFDLDGKPLSTIGLPGGGDKDGAFSFPAFLTVMRNGNIAVADSMNSRVQILDPDGNFIRKFGRRGDSPGEFQLIKGIASDSENHLYIADGKANTVLVYSDTGDYLISLGGPFAAERVVAQGGFVLPQGVYIDVNDTIYVADQMNHRFQIFQYMNERYLKEHPVEAAPIVPPAPAGK